jgi:hypothetical protein
MAPATKAPHPQQPCHRADALPLIIAKMAMALRATTPLRTNLIIVM